MKYRTKPRYVEAFRFGFDKVPTWFLDRTKKQEAFIFENSDGSLSHGSIYSPKDPRRIYIGYWVILFNDGDMAVREHEKFIVEFEEVSHENIQN